ncbi:MAG: ABC transporter ATP-binding protein [Mollicutes bacterium PWAP]|nr:ABC transporter ATP-binding protein [Mollicutes bacterium PWAP]
MTKEELQNFLDKKGIIYNKKSLKKELEDLKKKHDSKNNPQEKNDENKVIVDVEDLRVSFRDVNKRKNIIDIIRGISFKINKGEIIGFIGESGSGKSVTAKSLFGMNTNSITTAKKMIISNQNMILKDKEVISKNKIWKKLRGKKVTYIPQNPMTSLNPTMKIKNQILEIINISDKYKSMSYSEKIDIIVELLERFGLKDSRININMYPHEFSGGMRQRVVIAMAVFSNPDIIIADEPTTALDPTVQASVLELLKSITIDFNISLIFVSHDISVVSTLVDYIYVFYAGRVIEQGTKFEILTNSKHPYTWALFSSMPESSINGEELFTLDGTPPNFSNLPPGDPFSSRNIYAMEIDFKIEPKLFDVPGSKTHKAATWLLHPNSPKVTKPLQVLNIEKMALKEKNVIKKHKEG